MLKESTERVTRTAEQRQMDARVDAARGVDAAIGESPMSHAAVARAAGMSRQKLCAALDEENGSRHLRLFELLSMPLPIQLRWARRYFGRLGIALVECATAPATVGHFERLARLSHEHAEMMAAYVDGLSTEEGRFTDAELERLERETLDVFCEAGATLEWVRRERASRADATEVRQ